MEVKEWQGEGGFWLKGNGECVGEDVKDEAVSDRRRGRVMDVENREGKG